MDKVVGIPGTPAATGLIPGFMKGVKGSFRKEYPRPMMKPDVAAAKKYLEAAKKELGLTTMPSVVWLTQDTPLAARESEYFQALLKRTLGIDLKVDKQIFKQRLAKMTSGDFDICSAGWGPDYDDPMTFADLFASFNANNNGKYENPKYDELVRKAMETSNQKVRMDAMAQAEKIMLDDVGMIPFYERIQMYTISPKLGGVIRRAIGFDPDLTGAAIK
jgi:oligopeptide transport system substrate-binding protein